MNFHINWQPCPPPVPPATAAQPPDFSVREFRASLGMFATGVTIVTARTDQGELVGLTANSFNSVSLDPPLVLWSLGQAAGSLAVFSNGRHYAINVLAADQKGAGRTLRHARRADRWTGVDFTLGVGGAPAARRLRRQLRVLQPQPVRRGRPRHLRGRGGALHAPAPTPRRCFIPRRPLLRRTSPVQGSPVEGRPKQGPAGGQPTRQAAERGGFVGTLPGLPARPGQPCACSTATSTTSIAAQGLTHIAWRVLAVLHDAALAHPDTQGSVAVGQLAHDVLAKQPTVTKLLQRMADDGLVALLADPTDQRRTLVAATGEGRRIAAALIAQARAQESALLSRWSPGEAEALKAPAPETQLGPVTPRVRHAPRHACATLLPP